MVLSFHPNIVADKNILCAGRLPNDGDKAAVLEAKAVILPQGPGEGLYRICRKHCAHVFPNYDARFDYPGKLEQARLFQKIHAPFPETYLFRTVSDFRSNHGDTGPLKQPCIYKSDWGGEGSQVFFVGSVADLEQRLSKAEKLEKGGQKGFLLQELIHHGGRSLRVVVIGTRLYSYWRRQRDASTPLVNIRTGAVIDHTSDSHLQDAGKEAVQGVCSATGINLAGFDLLFPSDRENPSPRFLEINYFFGRRGLGGSEKYYQLMDSAVAKWLESIGLSM